MSKELFTKYYKENTWRGQESVSGPGSDYEQTKFLVPELQILLKRFNIKSILDVPCGDFNWMKNIDLNGINYTGGDIVSEMVKKNNKRYRKNNVNFELIDIVNNSLPQNDLIIVRDCLVHLPNKDVITALKNIKQSRSKYLLTTNFSWRSLQNNKDIAIGAWRRINLQQLPFSFPNPEYVIIEGNIQSNDRDKTMSLWQIKDIPDYTE